ncbi:pyruvate dehydrogenase E2 component (dihydrolipoamide acetyltransferase) [Buchnera aphidicola (Cinara tujafilina)]|uniref:Dihydrolipoamide acetyltransferase component of pyruvate dehydrogenase complex n=1 Tax=Buchnera aphidicola (Cinara tujafilina) TaxID=261317 RepID=F7WZ71_9GAMM|nr:2-oxo acid dehydrogenase subunit E2 [Buchnera aphidicola]AEH39725.1 pyruvate dehydrogenase E2 component (dihydrolipoamide acetyltransferase) [Buchnera aphidicola (Cinara tujafilina)]
MDIEILTPDIGIEKVEVTEILVQEGIKIQKEDSIVSVESQKSVLEIPSPYAGIVKKFYIKVGDFLTINTLLMTLHVNKSIIHNKNLLNKSNISQNNLSKSLKNIRSFNKNQENINIFKEQEKIYASPNIRRVSKILKINLLDIVGTGRNGRIIMEDLYKYQQLNTHNSIENISQKNILLHEKNKKLKILNFFKLNKVQQIIGKNLINTWNNVPHVTQFDEADITELDQFRQCYNKKCIDKKNNLSILPFLIKCIERSLYQFPNFNSSLTSCGTKIILKKKINIGIAVETDFGLLVPVLKNLYYKSISCISLEIKNLVLKAKKNQLHISETQHGSFTVSNLGHLGGVGFTPIINFPEVCILGISKAVIKPVWKKKQFIPRLILPFSISYDHRVINGADAVRFTTFICDLLRDIRNLII